MSLSQVIGITTLGELSDLLDSSEPVELFEGNFYPKGLYSLDYIALLALYIVADVGAYEIPPDVETERLVMDMLLAPPNVPGDISGNI